MQIIVKAIANPVVVQAIETLIVAGVLDISRKLLNTYIDREAHRQAKAIVKNIRKSNR